MDLFVYPSLYCGGFEIKYKSSRLQFMKVKKSEDYGVNLKILIREICGGTRVTIQKQSWSYSNIYQKRSDECPLQTLK